MQASTIDTRPAVCFFGQTRYAGGNDPSLRDRLRLLTEICRPAVIARSSGWLPMSVREGDAVALLLPSAGPAFIRYPLFVSGGTLLLLWLVLARKCRTIVAQSPLEGVIAVAVARLCQVVSRRPSVIIENHGDFSSAAGLIHPGYVGRLLDWLGSTAGVWAIERADALRAVSAYTATRLRAINPKAPIHTFPALTPLAMFSKRLRQEHPGVVVFVGSLTYVKGVDVLLNALASLPPDRRPSVRLVGPAVDETFAKSLMAQTRRDGLASSVTFVGSLPPDEVAREMSEAAVVVVPSRSEALPRVVLEALAAGAPVVASNVGGVPEIVQDGVTGILVPPGDVQALASALDRVLANDALRHELSSSGRAFIQSLIPSNYFVEGYRRLFDATLGTKARSAAA